MTMRESGVRFTEIGRVLGDHYMTISRWWDRHKEGGAAALAVQMRGPAASAHRRLTSRHKQAIRRAITDPNPDQLKLTFALWTRAAIIVAIATRYRITLPVRTMGHYLKHWGFTTQKPIRRAHEQCPEAIAAWLTTEYFRIQRHARALGRGDLLG